MIQQAELKAALSLIDQASDELGYRAAELAKILEYGSWNFERFENDRAICTWYDYQCRCEETISVPIDWLFAENGKELAEKERDKRLEDKKRREEEEKIKNKAKLEAEQLRIYKELKAKFEGK